MARQMTERVAISPEVKAKLTEFKEGAGMSFDDAIDLLLEIGTLNGLDLRMSGAELRYARARGRDITPASIKDN